MMSMTDVLNLMSELEQLYAAIDPREQYKSTVRVDPTDGSLIHDERYDDGWTYLAHPARLSASVGGDRRRPVGALLAALWNGTPKLIAALREVVKERDAARAELAELTIRKQMKGTER
jgi:hypothetical protein